MKFDFFVNKNKIIIISFIVLVLFFFVSSSVFGAEGISFKYNDTEYSLPVLTSDNFDSNNDLIILGYSSKSDFRSFGLVVLKNAKSYIDDGCRIETSTSGRYSFIAHKLGAGYYSNPIDFYFFKYDSSNVVWSQWGSCYNLSNTTDACEVGNFDIIYTQCDLFNSNGDVLFRGAPSSKIAFFELTGAEQIPQAMLGVAKIVLPVGLIVLGIGLLIYLIKRVIYSMK